MKCIDSDQIVQVHKKICVYISNRGKGIFLLVIYSVIPVLRMCVCFCNKVPVTPNISFIAIFLKFLTKWHLQTVQTQVRKKKQSDQGYMLFAIPPSIL